MLQKVCEYIHNYFIKESRESFYEITGGMISLSFLKEGQRFLISGSDLNDGVYTYHSNGIKNDDDTAVAGLSDEEFSGMVSAMAVPPSVIALAGEIQEWVDTYAESVNSPYQSESFGGYSYTKASGGTGNGASSVGWEDVFSKQLNRWRRIAV